MTNKQIATTAATYESLELDRFDPALLREYASQRIEAAAQHLQEAQTAIADAHSDRMFVVGDQEEVPPAYLAMQRAESSLAAAADCLIELDAGSQEISQFVIGVTEAAHTLFQQREAVLAQYNNLTEHFEERVREEVQNRLDEALLDQLATAGELDKENIRSMAEEINDAGGDVQTVAAWHRDELERTLRAAETLAAELRTRQDGSADPDDGEYEDDFWGDDADAQEN